MLGLFLPLLVLRLYPWAHHHQRLIRRVGRRLNREETTLAFRLGVKRPHAVRLLYIDQVPMPRGWLIDRVIRWVGADAGANISGMALGYGIYLRKDHEGVRSLLAHELIHTRQSENGFLRFIVGYLYQCLRYGYHDAPMECEARDMARRY